MTVDDQTIIGTRRRADDDDPGGPTWTGRRPFRRPGAGGLARLVKSAAAMLAVGSVGILLPLNAAQASIPPSDGTDPIATGCAVGITTPRSAQVRDNSGHLLGSILLRWSARCGTNWAVAVANGGPTYVNPVVVRQSDGKWCGASPGFDPAVRNGPSGCYYNPTWYASQAYTNQVKGVGVCVYAEGWIWSPWDRQFYFAKTASAC